MERHAELITDIVEKEIAFRERMSSDADMAMTDLIDNFLDPDQRIINLPNFRSALSQAYSRIRAPWASAPSRHPSHSRAPT